MSEYFSTPHDVENIYTEIKNIYNSDSNKEQNKYIILKILNDCFEKIKISLQSNETSSNLFNLKILMETQFIRDVKCQYNYLFTPDKCGCDLRELVFNFETETNRTNLLNNIKTLSETLTNNHGTIPHIITDIDEIPNPERILYIKEKYDLNGIFKLEMDNYFGSLLNRQKEKWYHPKVINWGNLKSRSIEECRLTFDCQWWEKGGWHFTYFGGPSRISAKLNDFSHQEYNTDYYKDENYIFDKIKNGEDLFGEWRKFDRIDPEENEFLPKNWRILQKFNEKIYSDER